MANDASRRSRDTKTRPLTVAIVGGGASGVLTGIHLLRHPSPVERRILLVDRRAAVGSGTAFGTRRPCHLLNVPAARMSAFPDEPEHFEAWARQRDAGVESGTFVPRVLYGDYLRDVLAEQSLTAPARSRLHAVTDEVDFVAARGDRGIVCLRDSGTIEADVVVLALGNLPPRRPVVADDTLLTDGRYVADPWSPGALDRVQPDEPVVLIGSGLTAVDVMLSLRSRGHRASIAAVSRRGLLPQAHRDGRCHAGATPDLAAVVEATTARQLARTLREAAATIEAAGGDWRDVVDGLRGHTQTLWTNLDDRERERFVRHASRYWEVHRHRMAPQVAATVDELRRDSVLTVHAGRITELTPEPDRVRVGVETRASGHLELHAGHVVNCMGPRHDVIDAGDPVIDALHEAGAVRAGPLGLGFDVDRHGAVVGADGRPSPTMFTLGALRRGVLWESTAVPEIRTQAAALADEILGRARHRAHTPSPASEPAARRAALVAAHRW